MKRILVLLFALAVLLTGCSAGGIGGHSAKPSAVDENAFNTGVGQSVCAVLLSVNPQIKIFLEDARNVTAIQCVNEVDIEYWIGNTLIGGIAPSGNAWGDTFATYSGPIEGGSIGVGGAYGKGRSNSSALIVYSSFIFPLLTESLACCTISTENRSDGYDTLQGCIISIFTFPPRKDGRSNYETTP